MRPTEPLKGALKRSLGLVGLEIHRRSARASAPGGKPADPHIVLATHVAGLLELLAVEVVLDVGANVGKYGRLLRKHGYRGRIVAFEPISAAFAELELAAAQDPLWDVHRVALGRDAGRATMNVMKSNVFASFLTPNDYGRAQFPNSELTYAEEVDVVRLDAVFDELVAPLERPRTYLKMDTQGSDLEVLAGADGCLDVIVALQSEISVRNIYEGMTDWLEALAVMSGRGFAPTGIFPVIRDEAWRVIEFDCVMTRTDA